MADAFPVSGNIDPVSFPHLLVDLHRHGATGSLKVTGPVHPKALYFRGGRVLFGSSNDPRDQLGAILIDSGRITREQLDEVNAKVGPGNPLAKVLAESGFVNQRELGEAARMKVESILADVLSWTSGSFEFEDGVLPKGAVDLKLSTEKLLLAAVKRISDRAFALRHVELSNVLEALPEGESALSEVRADVWPLLERLDGRRTLKDAVALTRLDEFEAVKTACAMLFLGIAKRKVATPSELDLAEQAQSGFGGDVEAMYTVPLTAVAVADLPRIERVRVRRGHAGVSGAGAGTRAGGRNPRGRGPPLRAVPRSRGRARGGAGTRGLQRGDHDDAGGGVDLHDGRLPEARRGAAGAEVGLRAEDRGATRDGLRDARAVDGVDAAAAAHDARSRAERTRAAERDALQPVRVGARCGARAGSRTSRRRSCPSRLRAAPTATRAGV